MPRRVLVTGATGFLGKRFVLSLCEEDDIEIFVLVRSKAGEDASARLAGIGLNHPNIIPVEGDVTDETLPEKSRDLPAIDELWHVAGLTDFHESKREQLVKVNVAGTRNTIELARRLNISRFYHVSTAYVAGICSGPVHEDDLVRNPIFRNPYEETKYHGEKLVRESQLPWVVIRPSIIMGDSQTGAVENDKMIYGGMKVYDMFRRLVEREYRHLGGPPAEVRYFVRGKVCADKNMVCVDDVVKLMTRVRSAGEVGKTYHGTHSQIVTIGTLHDTIVDSLGIRYLEMTPDLPDTTDSKQRFVNKGLKSLIAYMVNSDPTFCQDNVQRLGGWRPQPMENELVRFLVRKFAEELARPNGSSHGPANGSMDPGRLKDVKRFGSFTLAYDTMSTDFSAFRSAGSEGYLAYKLVDNCALLVGDPVSSEPKYLLQEFFRWCQSHNLNLCAIQVRRDTAEVLREAGLAVNKLGVETFVDLTPNTVDMSGGDFQSIRNFNNIAQRNGLRLVEGELTERRIQEMQQLSEYWIKSKKNQSELRVLARKPSTHGEPGVRHFFLERDDRLLACIFFTPIYSAHKTVGYYANVERYSLENEGLPNRFNAMKYIVYQAIQHFDRDDISYVALGMSPLHDVAHSEFNDHPELTRLFEQLYEENELYAFKGIATHKKQYPCRREEPVYIVTASDTAPADILNVFRGVGLLDG